MAGPGSAAEQMDKIYRHQRFIYDATRRYYLFGRDHLIEDLSPPDRGTVLEIGCGTARNLIRASERFPSAQFYGLDVSEEMLLSARATVARRGKTAQILLRQGDATAFDPKEHFALQTFDRVFISYALSMIPAWEDVVRAAARCVGPGGKLLIVDFGDFADYPGIFKHIQLLWLRQFSVLPIPAIERKMNALAEQMGFSTKINRLYGGYAIKMCLQPR